MIGTLLVQKLERSARGAALALVFLPAAAASENDFGWTISASSTDPGANWALPLQVPGNVDLYLWLGCSPYDSLVAAEFAISGTLSVLQFTPLNGFVNLGTPANLLLQNWSCPVAPALAGILTVQDPGGGGTLCFTPSEDNFLTSVTCATFLMLAMDWVGFASDGSFPCYEIWYDGDAWCGIHPPSPPPPTGAGEGTEASSFGRVKASYR